MYRFLFVPKNLSDKFILLTKLLKILRAIIEKKIRKLASLHKGKNSHNFDTSHQRNKTIIYIYISRHLTK